jgi:hypothetical protein
MSAQRCSRSVAEFGAMSSNAIFSLCYRKGSFQLEEPVESMLAALDRVGALMDDTSIRDFALCDEDGQRVICDEQLLQAARDKRKTRNLKPP